MPSAIKRRKWEAGASNLNPAIASTCTTRTLLLWLNQLQELLEGDTLREKILKTMPTLAAAVIAGISAEAAKIPTKATALINSARRALWLRVDGGCRLQKQIMWYPFHWQASLWTRSVTSTWQVSRQKKGVSAAKEKAKQNTFFVSRKKRCKQSETRKRWSFQRKKNREDFIFKPWGNTKKQWRPAWGWQALGIHRQMVRNPHEQVCPSHGKKRLFHRIAYY